MSHSDRLRQSHTRAAKAHLRSKYRVRIGNVTVTADELRAWQLGPLFGRNDQNGRNRHGERG